MILKLYFQVGNWLGCEGSTGYTVEATSGGSSAAGILVEPGYLAEEPLILSMQPVILPVEPYILVLEAIKVGVTLHLLARRQANKAGATGDT